MHRARRARRRGEGGAVTRARPRTLLALDEATEALSDAHRAVNDELGELYREIDRLRAECARLQSERDAMLEIMREAVRRG